MNDNICVLVVAHKEFNDSILKDGYKVIRVGANNSGLKDSFLRDNDGDNISDLNPYYCELTGLYWAWKNFPESVEYIGLTHYRRYFCDYIDHNTSISENIIRKDRIISILTNHDVILPHRSAKAKNMFKVSLKEPILEQDIYMGLVDQILEEKYPQMLETWRELISGNSMIWKNMFITKRKIFEDYCEWIFDVLFEFDRRFENQKIEKLDRVDGFLAEYLTATYFLSKIEGDRMCFMDIRDPEEKTTMVSEFIRRNAIISNVIRKIRNAIR